MYSLANASTLGFDLVRLPGGAVIAATLIDALVTTAEDLGALSTAVRAESAARVATPSAARVMAARHLVRTSSLTTDLAVFGSALAVAPLGTFADLEAFVAGEVFDWCWTGGPGLSTRIPAAAAAVWNVSAHLEQAWGAVGAAPPAPRTRGDLGPQTGRLVQLLDITSTLTTHDVARLDAVAAHRRPGVWSQAMHEATAAVDLTGRLRTSALSQLHLVLSVKAAGLPPVLVAGSVWNSLSGLTMAMMVEDLLAAGALRVLRDPGAALFGL